MPTKFQVDISNGVATIVDMFFAPPPPRKKHYSLFLIGPAFLGFCAGANFFFFRFLLFSSGRRCLPAPKYNFAVKISAFVSHEFIQEEDVLLGLEV